MLEGAILSQLVLFELSVRNFDVVLLFSRYMSGVLSILVNNLLQLHIGNHVINNVVIFLMNNHVMHA